MKYTLLAEIAFLIFLWNAPVAGAAVILGAKGNYGGLLQVPEIHAARPPLSSSGVGVVRGHIPSQDPLNSGSLTVQVGKSGRFTALLNWKGFQYGFKGAFDPTTLTFERDLADRDNPGANLALKLVLQPAIPPTDSTPKINGSIQCELTALGSKGFYTAKGDLSGAEPDPAAGEAFAGSLNTSFIDPPDYGTLPQDIKGDGFSVTRVSKRGGLFARLVGRLPDNEPFSSGSSLRGTTYTIFSGLYFKNGRFGGITIGELEAQAEIKTIQNVVIWSKAEGADPEYYRSGFETGYGIKTLVYLISRLGGGKQLPQISTNPGPVNATVTFRDGNIGEERSVKIKITPFGVKVLEPNPQRVSMRTNALAATWSGSFDHPVSGLRTSFHGGFVQARPPINGEPGKNGAGRGSFRGSLAPKTPGFVESGSVRLIVD